MSFPTGAPVCRSEESGLRESCYHPWPSCRSFLGILLQKVKCHPHLPQVMSPTSRTSGISDKANRSSQNTPGQEGNKDTSKAMVERTQSGNCYNYVNLNLAMAEAVNDTLFVGKRCHRIILMTTRASVVLCGRKMPLQEQQDPGAWV